MFLFDIFSWWYYYTYCTWAFKPLPVFNSFVMMNILCEWCWFDTYWFFLSFCFVLFFSPVFWGRIVRSRRVWTLEPFSLCDWKIFGLISILEISLYYRNVDTITYSRTVWNVWNIYFFHVRFILHCPVSLKEILSCWYSIGCIS